MNIAFVGDTHGRLRKMYRMVDAWEIANNKSIDFIVQVGDFGIWKDDGATARMGKTHRHNSDILDYLELGEVPRPTYFIRGNHEDFTWLFDLHKFNTGKIEIVKDLFYLRNGYTIDIGGINFGCLGGNYGKGNYEGSEDKAKQMKRRHFYADELSRLKNKNIDILLTHDCPDGILDGKNFLFPDVGSPKLNELMDTISPAYYFHGHYHWRQTTTMRRTKIISLDKTDRWDENSFNWDSLFVLNYEGRTFNEL